MPKLLFLIYIKKFSPRKICESHNVGTPEHTKIYDCVWKKIYNE